MKISMLFHIVGNDGYIYFKQNSQIFEKKVFCANVRTILLALVHVQ